MTTHTMPAGFLAPSPYAADGPGHFGTLRTPARLAVAGMRACFGISYVDATGECRRTTGGPIERGPWAAAYGRPVVIDNAGGSARLDAEADAAGMVLHVELGDTIVFPDGEHFVVRMHGQDRHNIDLHWFEPRSFVAPRPTSRESVMEYGLRVLRHNGVGTSDEVLALGSADWAAFNAACRMSTSPYDQALLADEIRWVSVAL